nr:hypothetical protein [Burkholderia multivorans]
MRRARGHDAVPHLHREQRRRDREQIAEQRTGAEIEQHFPLRGEQVVQPRIGLRGQVVVDTRVAHRDTPLHEQHARGPRRRRRVHVDRTLDRLPVDCELHDRAPGRDRHDHADVRFVDRGERRQHRRRQLRDRQLDELRGQPGGRRDVDDRRFGRRTDRPRGRAAHLFRRYGQPEMTGRKQQRVDPARKVRAAVARGAKRIIHDGSLRVRAAVRRTCRPRRMPSRARSSRRQAH